MMRICAVLLLVSAAASPAASLLPTEQGTNWPYKMTQELGDGVSLPGAVPGRDGKVHSDVIYRLDGTENAGGESLLKFEMHRNGLVTNTELMTVDDHGLHCATRIGPDGERVSLVPPQTIVAAPLEEGLSWDFAGKAGGVNVQQHYAVLAAEDVTVPAGRFHAFHIHGEQSAPEPMTIERWFVEGVGIVKDITTMRNKDGGMVQRIELDLKEKPKTGPRPDVQPPKKLSVGLSSEAVGPFTTNFSTAAPKICARWQGHGLRSQASIRVVWIAEDVGEVAPPNYKIDEAKATASIPGARGVFTLSRPEDGWAPGAYRVEFYVDGELIETVKLKIGQLSRSP
jgi:hypothetical protein